MINIDFLPQVYREARQRRRLRMRRLSLAAVGVCVLAAWFGADELRLHRTRGQLDCLVRQSETVQAGLEHMAKLQAEQTQLLDRYRLIQELQSPASCVTTLQRIAELLPEHVVLRQLQLTCGASGNLHPEMGPVLKREPESSGAVRMVLTGLAPSQVDIAVLVGRLSGCREFANVRLDYSKAAELELHQVHEFRVTFDVVTSAAGSSVAAQAKVAMPGEGA